MVALSLLLATVSLTAPTRVDETSHELANASPVFLRGQSLGCQWPLRRPPRKNSEPEVPLSPSRPRCKEKEGVC